MIATSHIIIGGTVGVLTKNPAAGFMAGVASHFICDSIPHLDAPFRIEFRNQQADQIIWTKKLWVWAIADSSLAFVLTLFLWMKLSALSISSPLAWGAFGAYLPDLLDNFPLWSTRIRLLPGFRKFHKFHLSTHNLWRFRFPMPENWLLGTVSQIIFIIPCLWFLFK